MYSKYFAAFQEKALPFNPLPDYKIVNTQIYVSTVCKERCRSLNNKKQNTQKSVAFTGNRTTDLLLAGQTC